MVAQAVIEKIALPLLAMLSRDELLPVPDGRFAFPGSRGNAIIACRRSGISTQQAAMPARSLVVEFHGGEQGIASYCAAELVLARRHAVDGDKELTSLGHPLRNRVR
jgi:hypothetical protein